MITIIIPFFNEAENLPLLHKELVANLPHLSADYEMIFVDDGSTDGSAEAVETFKADDAHVKLLRQRKQFGKGKALASALKIAKGEIVVFMDADLQDDPADLQHFYEMINQGYDLVNGKRKVRKDNAVIKSYSNFFNWFLQRFLHSPFTDINCGFKMMRRHIFNDIVLYANNFRFLPLAAYRLGYKVGEVPVHNRNRKFGVSKYGFGKAFGGMIDTLSAYFIYQFAEQPLHFFGIVGGVSFVIGLVIAIVLSVERLFFGMLLYRRPSLLLAVMLMIVGIQIVMTGIIGELIVYLNKKKQD